MTKIIKKKIKISENSYLFQQTNFIILINKKVSFRNIIYILIKSSSVLKVCLNILIINI